MGLVRCGSAGMAAPRSRILPSPTRFVGEGPGMGSGRRPVGLPSTGASSTSPGFFGKVDEWYEKAPDPRLRSGAFVTPG